MVLVAGLKTRRNPNVEDTDVDCGDENGSGNHNLSRVLAIRHNDTDTVDDDLQQQLDLDTPPEEDREVEGEA
jgi:hypothetical protein